MHDAAEAPRERYGSEEKRTSLCPCSERQGRQRHQTEEAWKAKRPRCEPRARQRERERESMDGPSRSITSTRPMRPFHTHRAPRTQRRGAAQSQKTHTHVFREKMTPGWSVCGICGEADAAQCSSPPGNSIRRQPLDKGTCQDCCILAPLGRTSRILLS